MGKMAHCHFFLDINVCEKRTFVVDPEGKDAVLIRKFEACAEDGAIRRSGSGFEIEAVKGR